MAGPRELHTPAGNSFVEEPEVSRVFEALLRTVFVAAWVAATSLTGATVATAVGDALEVEIPLARLPLDIAMRLPTSAPVQRLARWQRQLGEPTRVCGPVTRAPRSWHDGASTTRVGDKLPASAWTTPSGRFSASHSA
jgi:hypothetical protein